MMVCVPIENMWLFNAGKRAFIAGVADDQGYGWAIAKALAAAGAEILVGTWVPVSVYHLVIQRSRAIVFVVKKLLFSHRGNWAIAGS